VYDSIPCEDKTMITYDEIDHSIFQDGEYLPLVVKDISDWIAMRGLTKLK